MSLARSIGVLAVVAFICLSATINYDYGVSFATTPRHGMILGLVSIAADVLKSVLPIVVAGAIAERAWGRTTAGSVLFVLTLLYAFASAVGFGAENRGGVAASRANLTALLRDAERDASEARGRLQSLQSVRPAGVVAAEEAALRQDRRWVSSEACTVATSSASRSFCQNVERLRGEAAAAAEATVLRAKIERLDRDIQRLRERGADAEIDPQASAIGWVVRRVLGDVDEAGVRSGLTWLLAALIEAVSAFGLYACGVREQGWRRGRAERKSNVIEGKAVSAAPVGGTAPPSLPAPRALALNEWAMARLSFVGDGVVLIDEALADYRRHAAAAGLEALPDREVRRGVQEAMLALELEIWGDELRGVALVSAEVEHAVAGGAGGRIDRDGAGRMVAGVVDDKS